MNSNIDSIYRLNDSDRVLQGDILKDLDVPIYNKELKLNKLKFGEDIIQFPESIYMQFILNAISLH